MRRRHVTRTKAAACEFGLQVHDRCRCSCSGLLHGAHRVTSADDLDLLPWDDPHFPRGGQPALPLWGDHKWPRAAP